MSDCNEHIAYRLMKYLKNHLFKIRTEFKKVLESLFLFILSVIRIEKTVSDKQCIKKILIPLFAGVGDAIIFTACLEKLSNIFPNVMITLLTNERTHSVLESTYPRIDFIQLQSFFGLFRLRNKFDLMLSPGRNMRNYVVAMVTHPEYLIGYNYSLIIQKGESHIARLNRIVRQLGGSDILSPVLRISQSEKDKAFNIIKNIVDGGEKDVVCFIIGGRWETKVYSPSRYRFLAEQLINKYNVDIFLIGTQHEVGEVIADGNKRVHNLAGRTTIKEAMGLILHSRFVVGPDGGLLNIAMALNKPIVGLFGPVDPIAIVQFEYLDSILYLKNCEYQPCYNEEHEPICPYENAICMEFAVDDIIDKVDRIFSKRSKRESNSLHGKN